MAGRTFRFTKTMIEIIKMATKILVFANRPNDDRYRFMSIPKIPLLTFANLHYFNVYFI